MATTLNLAQELEQLGVEGLAAATTGVATSVAAQGSSVKTAVAGAIQTSGATTLETAQAAVNAQLPALTSSITAKLPTSLQSGLLGALASFGIQTLLQHELNQAFVGVDRQALGAKQGEAAATTANNLP
jgi:hypothetical protein